MPEKLKELPVPFYLSQKRKIDSRKLYEQVFAEDSERFVDYYYQYKIRDNRILVLEDEGQIVSMIHLNPYRIIINGYETESNYIVAVATQEGYRHRGCMRVLLERVLQDMSTQGIPFTFLMPASERIYVPFDFVWICSYTVLSEQMEQMDGEMQNRYLAEKYQMFCKRDERYMENRNAERLAESGEEPPENMPPYMARITDVCQMLRLVRGRQKRALYLHVTDSIISKNNGYFLWNISEEDSRVEKLENIPKKLDLNLTVGELTSMIFDGFRICLSEVV